MFMKNKRTLALGPRDLKHYKKLSQKKREFVKSSSVFYIKSSWKLAMKFIHSFKCLREITLVNNNESPKQTMKYL